MISASDVWEPGRGLVMSTSHHSHEGAARPGAPSPARHAAGEPHGGDDHPAVDHMEHTNHGGHDAHAGHDALSGHDAHAGHDMGAMGHGGHGDHVAMFRRLFWIMLALSVPTVLLSGMFASIVGYS